MKILITGGTGFLGRHTALRLLQNKNVVSILGRNDRIGKELEKVGITYRRAELSDRDTVVSACKDHELVINCGGLASPWGKYDDFHKANVVGTQNIIAGCFAHKIERLVHISTPSLYFNYHHRLNISERDPLPKKQATFYAETKLLADREIEKAKTKGLQPISLRPRGIFGPGDQNVLGRILRAAEKGTIPLVGGGKSYVDLTYIENVVDAILLCVNAPEELMGRTYNITNDEPMQTRQMLELLFSKLKMNPRFLPMPFPMALTLAAAIERIYGWFRKDIEPPLSRYAVGLMAKSQTLDISAAKQDLGYDPKIKIEEGMERFASWWLRQKKGTHGLDALGLGPM